MPGTAHAPAKTPPNPGAVQLAKGSFEEDPRKNDLITAEVSYFICSRLKTKHKTPRDCGVITSSVVPVRRLVIGARCWVGRSAKHGMISCTNVEQCRPGVLQLIQHTSPTT